MASPTIFHLIRHASYALLGRTLAGRSEGHALNAKGRAEAIRVAEHLARRRLAAILTSPVQRAQETAAIIAERLGLPVETEPDLSEIDFGVWTGKDFSALNGLPEWETFNTFRGTAPIPGGETMLDAQARAVGALLRLRARWPGAELALVSHGDIVKVVLAHVLGAPLDLLRRMELAPASRSIVVLGDRDATVSGMNLPADPATDGASV